MKKTTVHNLIIVDASGSMCLIYDQALIGINQTIKTVKELQQGDATIDQHITLLSFADGLDEPEYIYDGKQINEVSEITKKEYKLRGNTALYDAIGKSVSKLRESMADGDKALVTIITDGQENDSRTWDEKMVKDLIEELKNFIAYAKDHPHLQFLVTEVGCGNAGWDVADMSPLFADAKEVKNISLPKKFWQYL